MPKLWDDTIESHRDAVCDAIYAATAAIVASQGLARLTMSGIAQEVGIGRATLYKYFSDVDEVVAAWQHHAIDAHLTELHEIAQRAGDPGSALRAVLAAYVETRRVHPEAVMLAHAAPHMDHAHGHLEGFIASLAAAARPKRSRVDPQEFARFAVAAAGAAAGQSRAAAGRLLDLIVSALG